MSHLHWVTRQNKLEIPNDKDEVNTREIHKCDGQAHDPDKRPRFPENFFFSPSFFGKTLHPQSRGRSTTTEKNPAPAVLNVEKSATRDHRGGRGAVRRQLFRPCVDASHGPRYMFNL